VKCHLWILVILAIIIGDSVQAAEVGAIQCEYRTNPQGIDNPHPRLTWIILSKRRGDIQTAYRILVASQKGMLAANEGDLWDSGWVPQGHSVDVAYAGKPLVSRGTYFWKVRVWDREGHPSDWSAPASWTMGLLSPSDWQAQWISDPVLANPTNWPMTPIHCYRSEPASRSDAAKWIVLDLGTNQQMDAVDIVPARPKGENGDFRTAMFPVRFKVETASNPDFSDARLVVDETGSDFPGSRSNSCRFPFTAVQARYVRLTVTRLAGWDGQVYGLALGGFEVFDGSHSIAVGAHVDCSDSMESASWSKQFLVTGKLNVALAGDSPALAAGVPQVKPSATISRVPMLRREFDLPGKVRRATLYVSARGFYEVHINGQRVGDELLAPGYTDYSQRLQYRTYDVTDLLRRGPNAIGALLGYGWYAGHINLHDIRSIDGYFPQFLAQLEIELANGGRVTINSDGQWRSTLNGPVRWSDLLDGEGYDSRREMPGWDKTGFDDRDWLPVWTQPRNDVPLVPQFCQPVRKILELRPVSVRETKPGVYVYDFGQEITGWCRLKAKGPAGTFVRLRHAEMVASGGNIDVKNLWGVRQEDDYILRGHGSQIFEPHFTYHGFRYVELSGLPEKLGADALVAVNIRSDLPIASHFECSNTLYNRIQKAAFWTQANLVFDVPAGCAARGERLAWTGDIRPCVQSLLFNFDAASFLTKYTQDLRDGQSAEGRFTDICPHNLLRGTTKCVGAPGWADAGVTLPWDLYVNTGDQQMLAEHYEAAKRWVDFIHSNNPDLIWEKNRGNDWGDWLSAGPATPKELGATAMFAHSTDLVARMARVLGCHPDAEYYSSLFQHIRQAFVNKYVGTNGIFFGAGDVQGSYALALDFDLMDEPLKSRAVARLMQLVKENKDHPTTGFWSSVELLLALSKNGCNDEAARMLDQPERPSWGYMASQNTTMWEAFNANTRNLSLNHWTHSAVNEWLWRYVAGLSPDARSPHYETIPLTPGVISHPPIPNPDDEWPGYETFTIAPCPTAEVTWCRASYDSIRGLIVSNWRCDGHKFNLEVTIPANAEATVTVPTIDMKTVTESGRPAAQSRGVTQLCAGPDSVTYRVGSGTYHFMSDYLPAGSTPEN
jgi:alpha-L-rhamnosidase